MNNLLAMLFHCPYAAPESVYNIMIFNVCWSTIFHDSRVSGTDVMKLWWKKWVIMPDVQPGVLPVQFSEMNVKSNITDKTGFFEILRFSYV